MTRPITGNAKRILDAKARMLCDLEQSGYSMAEADAYGREYTRLQAGGADEVAAELLVIAKVLQSRGRILLAVAATVVADELLGREDVA